MDQYNFWTVPVEQVELYKNSKVIKTLAVIQLIAFADKSMFGCTMVLPNFDARTMMCCRIAGCVGRSLCMDLD